MHVQSHGVKSVSAGSSKVTVNKQNRTQASELVCGHFCLFFEPEMNIFGQEAEDLPEKNTRTLFTPMRWHLVNNMAAVT